ncbi:L,D-transpeptidase [Mucilaginibacter gynuensis]
MNNRMIMAAAIAALAVVGCNNPKTKQDKSRQDTTKSNSVAPVSQNAMTLPALDALFYDKEFSASLKSQLGLTASEIGKLKATAHTSVRDLSEDGVDAGSAKAATETYEQKIKEIIGEAKAQQLLQLVNDRYSKGLEGLAPTQPNFVPKDTRIVVNAPAFRLDVFQDGKLVKTYRVGIGYPEFPLPTGMRSADTLIFNPSWTPPDEPWVRGKFAPGRKVSGANEDNPLGAVKIPIGMPSLIHGGKPLEKIGNFASHGCVGMTNKQVQDLTALVAQLGGSELTAAAISQLRKAGNTKSVKLKNRVPVDLRYETIVAENGALHIYRDVYERGTNTLENAKAILKIYGVDYNGLTEQEKSDLDSVLKEMNRDAKGNAIAADSLPETKDGVPASKIARSNKGKVNRRVQGEKETQVMITALQRKGYPAAVTLDSGN